MLNGDEEYTRTTHDDCCLASEQETDEELEELAFKAVESRRIRRVLGQTVDHPIVDNLDHVLLNEGDLITREAIEHAREAGVLDRLLCLAHR